MFFYQWSLLILYTHLINFGFVFYHEIDTEDWMQCSWHILMTWHIGMMHTQLTEESKHLIICMTEIHETISMVKFYNIAHWVYENHSCPVLCLIIDSHSLHFSNYFEFLWIAKLISLIFSCFPHPLWSSFHP